ncbi:pirin family protein [Paenibacillus glycanilyticus]|uniref:Quercetin 2,3-dioxygenase n=1 Tax=Paenibacillus glycanilyticus TaxID=126569 RepID=A0ABQ6GEL1_9BACL|nr:pirin family protein [Paenibacillus glycanilyticus]GLX69414.1 quercetin 2,3-dioxygenase [Paenibacillus glycanilyticus]
MTTTFRAIEGVFQGAPFHMVGDGFRVSNYFPGGTNFGQRFSPFILMDYNAPFVFPPSREAKGVGAHPHRGFETVTIPYEGSVEHHDNMGNHGVVGPGDVQWMTAGSGLLHKEYHEKSFSEQGGLFHMIQLWVNLPRAHKMHAPKYQELLKADMGYAELPDGGGTVRVIAGSYNGVTGPAQTFTPINLFDMAFKANGTATFELPSAYNTAALVLKGSAVVNEDKTVSEGDFILFSNVEGDIRIQGLTDDTVVIVLSGEPIDEPVFQQGPFVMNSRQEVFQAFVDFQDGKMGTTDF